MCRGIDQWIDDLQLLNDRAGPSVSIFITGYGDAPITVQTLKAGGVEFLMKPIRRRWAARRDPALERSLAALGHEVKIQALRDCYASLTGREREVMASVGSGRLTVNYFAGTWKESSVRLNGRVVRIRSGD